jgi:hypothetical protein
MIEVLKNTVEILESKAVVYCQFYGAESEEVKQLNEEIKRVNMMILDIMVEE